jgi:hypothetical protein
MARISGISILVVHKFIFSHSPYLIFQRSAKGHIFCPVYKKQKLNYKGTFSDTKLLLPFRSSGAIQGKVPLTPPEIRVWHFTFDRPKSPTCIPNYENNL